jgi:tetratricopeptide (TPR) repeat protein
MPGDCRPEASLTKREELKRFDELAPRTSDTYYRLGFVYWEIGDRDLGLQHTRRAIELDPTNFDAHAVLGMMRAARGELDEALKAFDGALRLNAYHHSGWGNSAHWRRADVLIKLGRYQEAIEDCDRGIDIEPWDPIPYRRRALAHFHMNHYRQALADLSKAFELKPRNLETASITLAMSSKEECRDGVLDFLRKATLREDSKHWAHRTRALIYCKMGRHDEAESDLEAALRATKSDDKCWITLNDMAWSICMSPAQKPRAIHYALEWSEKSVRLKSTGTNLNTLGVAQYRAGQFREAIESLTKSHELDGEKIAGFNLFWLAMAQWQLGEKEKGRELFQQAITWTEKNQPKDEELAHFRTEAEQLLGINNKADSEAKTIETTADSETSTAIKSSGP